MGEVSPQPFQDEYSRVLQGYIDYFSGRIDIPPTTDNLSDKELSDLETELQLIGKPIAGKTDPQSKPPETGQEGQNAQILQFPTRRGQ